jgi:predicted membrane-bound mannosyltransferase/DNA-binding beta-propeller fold protein YncE
MADSAQPQTSSWLENPLAARIVLNWEVIFFGLILLAAIFTRFYDLGTRVVSHDETSHVYFSWQFFQGNGYAHDPVTHGPLQFHLIALSYFLFGDSDFAGRIPVALFSVATIGFLWAFRRYLTKLGALIAAALFLISPFLLYYGRYARNESYVGLFGLVMLWAILRYLDRGEDKYLYLLTASVALHFATKETSFIYVAQTLIFLGFLFLRRVMERDWPKWQRKEYFLPALMVGLALIAIAVGWQLVTAPEVTPVISSTDIVEPAVPGEEELVLPTVDLNGVTILTGIGGLALVGIALYFLVDGYGWEDLKKERSFGLMLLLFTLVVPHLAAFPVKWLGYDPLNYTETSNLILIGIVLVIMAVVSGIPGILWNRRAWLISVAIFYAIFIPLYTSIFTHPNGFFSGLVGSLGYWLEQQGVRRGSQPGFYYWGVQIPMYEYLAAFGTLLAARMGYKIWRRQEPRPRHYTPPPPDHNLTAPESRRMALYLLAYWAVTSLLAYTIAGEKMPWLTYHIAIPMLMLAGWAFARLLRAVDWARLKTSQGLISFGLVAVIILSTLGAIGMLLGTQPPFQGQETFQLQRSYQFILRLILIGGSAVWLGQIHRDRQAPRNSLRLQAGIVVVAGLALLTTRASFNAAFRNYDLATEYLVYAHMARGPKEVLEQIEDLSMRLYGSLDMVVAYDNDTSYPYWWYLRDFPNARFYGDQPGSDLREAPVILVGDINYGKIEPVVGQAYYRFDYVRIWWPNQDYFNFQPQSLANYYAAQDGRAASTFIGDYFTYFFRRLGEYLGDAQTRQGIYDIWMHRDFEAFLSSRGQSSELSDWSPARTMRMYVRKDIVAQIWDFGVEASPEEIVADPYEGGGIDLATSLDVGEFGSELGQLNTPRGLAYAPDGSFYVADSNNHRIVHYAADGSPLNAWGSFGDAATNAGVGGTFFEPWGVAVSPDGEFVYVADTWNHRIQKFDADGNFITMWGSFGQGSEGDFLWGPRDVVVTNEGHVLVTDTGNKLIKVYDADGNFIGQTGGFGLELGYFDEPVGLTYDAELSRVYVADTWNQRVQVFSYEDGLFEALDEWPIAGWYGQSLDNKPYLSVGADNRVYITDPERGRVIVYESDGSFVYFWGGPDQSAVQFGIALGIAAHPDGGVWVSDSVNNRLLFFEPPQ